MTHLSFETARLSSCPFLTVSVNDIDRQTTYTQDTSSLPQSRNQRVSLFETLASASSVRYTLSDDERDLETSILQFTHAILLPSPLFRNSIFLSLAQALFERARKSRLPGDVACCLKSLYDIRSPSFECLGVSQNKVIELLVNTLTLQMKLEPRSATQCLENMAALCHEQLSDSPNVLGPELSGAVESFAQAVIAHSLDSFGPPSQQIIDCLCEADARLPDSPDVSFALSGSFHFRFISTQSNEDYERAMAPLDRIIASHSLAGTSNQSFPVALADAARIAHYRFTLHGTPEYLEEAISRTRTHLISTSPEDPKHGDIVQSLKGLERRRRKNFGITHAVPEAHPSNQETIPSGISPFSHLAVSLADMNAMEPPSMSAEDYFPHLLAIDSLDRITDKTDIDEAVKYCRLLLATFQKSHVHQTTVTSMIIARSGDFLHHAFTVTKKPEYFDECIDVHRYILQTSDAHWAQFQVIVRLIRSLLSRFKRLKDRKDFDEMMQLFPIAANNTYTTVTTRFEVACRWAHLARTEGHSSTSTAYEIAMSLMQDALTFAPTLEIQHSHLVTMRSDIEKLPLDYASYLASKDPPKLEEAIETLERGRGLLWSEMRGLRTSIDNLHRVDPPLARKFANLNRDLEALATSISPMVQLNGGDVNGDGEQDPFGRVVVRQRKLLDERNSLITQIRLLPGFENFLMPPSFDTLRSAAANGPVIIVNHCNLASHIVILLSDSPPSFITTSDDFFDRASRIKDQLSVIRNDPDKGLDSMDYHVALTSALEVLYDLVGKPVVKRLQELNIPEQSRIWWCPTSVFCSLPLHAMGPIRSEGTRRLYFSDLYIPSYTPTLSALIESRKHNSHSSEKPSILLVAQPDESIQGARAEISHIRRLETPVTALISKKAKPVAVIRCLQDHSFAHFTCHGILETGKPFDASFKLHRGERLTLLEIIRSQLPSAEFAFLSACHTAEATKESFADEGLHLSAAVQYSGFRSVVGTMWAMADKDGPVLTEHFYASVFSEKLKRVPKGMPYYARTAEALRDAVQELRALRGKNRVTTERWVNFVHYGA